MPNFVPFNFQVELIFSAYPNALGPLRHALEKETRDESKRRFSKNKMQFIIHTTHGLDIADVTQL